MTWKKYLMRSHFDGRPLCARTNTFTAPSMYALASNALSAKAASASRRPPTGDPRASSRAADALFAFRTLRTSVPGKKRSRAIVASASAFKNPRGSKYDMRPVDFTATQKSAASPYGRAPGRARDGDPVPSRGREHLTRHADDSATWDEGDETVTLLSWRDAADRLRLVNRTLDALIEDATQECSIERDGEMCGVAVDKAMFVLAAAAREDEATQTLRFLLAAAGPGAGAACEAWCWRQAGTPNEPRARAFARVAARAFEHEAGVSNASAVARGGDARESRPDDPSRRSDAFLNNSVAAYLRDVREECPVFHGADETCGDVVDAALLMAVCSYVDVAEATRVVDAIVDAGEDAAMRAVEAWCVANPGAKHVDVIAARVAAARKQSGKVGK